MALAEEVEVERKMRCRKNKTGNKKPVSFPQSSRSSEANEQLDGVMDVAPLSGPTIAASTDNHTWVGAFWLPRCPSSYHSRLSWPRQPNFGKQSCGESCGLACDDAETNLVFS
jgi:hypothetical protein